MMSSGALTSTGIVLVVINSIDTNRGPLGAFRARISGGGVSTAIAHEIRVWISLAGVRVLRRENFLQLIRNGFRIGMGQDKNLQIRVTRSIECLENPGEVPDVRLARRHQNRVAALVSRSLPRRAAAGYPSLLSPAARLGCAVE